MILNEAEVARVPVTEVVVAEKTVQSIETTTTEEADKKTDKDQSAKSSIRFEKLQPLGPCNLTVDKLEPRVDTQKLMDEFQKCILPIVKRWKNNTDKVLITSETPE